MLPRLRKFRLELSDDGYQHGRCARIGFDLPHSVGDLLHHFIELDHHRPFFGPLLTNEHGAFSLDNHAPTEGQDPRQQTVASIRAGDLREEPLRAPRHPPGGHVVSGAMPRTDQATLAVDRSIAEIGTEMSTSASYREQLTVRVSDRVPCGATDNPRHQLGGGPHLSLSCHRPSHGSLALTVASSALTMPDRSSNAAGCDVATERGTDISLH